MAIFLPRRWRSQPQYVCQVDFAHPLAAGLIEYTLVTPQGLVSAAGQLSVEGGTTPTEPYYQPAGVGRRHKAASPATSYVYASGRGPSRTVDAYTLYARAQWLGGATSAPTSFATGRNVYGIALETPVAGMRGVGIAQSGEPNGRTWAGAITLGANRTTGVVTAGASVRDIFLYRPSGDIHTLQIIGVATTGTSSADSTSFTATGLFAYQGVLTATSAPGDKVLFVGGFWERVLTLAERLAIAENPWQLFVPLQRRIYFDFGGGAAGSTDLMPQICL